MSMTNEQREAIKICKERIIEPFYNFPNPTSIQLKDVDITAIETVLNMLKEKDKQIAKYEKIYKEYDCYRWVKEIEKKDKIIDLMAKAFKQDDVRSVEEIKQYFERKSES